MDEKKRKKRSAFDEIGYMLGFRARTRAEVETKLVEKGYSPEEIAEAMEKAKNYSWIDDAQYAANAVAASAVGNVKGKRALMYKLKKKGIDDEILENALSQISPEDEKEKAMKVATSVYAKSKDMEPRKLKEKLWRALAARGFEYDIITETVREVMACDSDE